MKDVNAERPIARPSIGLAVVVSVVCGALSGSCLVIVDVWIAAFSGTDLVGSRGWETVPVDIVVMFVHGAILGLIFAPILAVVYRFTRAGEAVGSYVLISCGSVILVESALILSDTRSVIIPSLHDVYPWSIPFLWLWIFWLWALIIVIVWRGLRASAMTGVRRRLSAGWRTRHKYWFMRSYDDHIEKTERRITHVLQEAPTAMPVSGLESRRTWSRRLLIAGALAGLVILASAVLLYRVPPVLPSDYGLFRTDAATIVLLGPDEATIDRHSGGIVVAAKISHLNVSQGFIYGRVEYSPYSQLYYMQTPGYFIVNTATHDVERGLSEAAYETRLRQLALPMDLFPANRFKSRIPWASEPES